MTTSSRIVVGADWSPASVAALRVEAVTIWQFPAQYELGFCGEESDRQEISKTTLDEALTAIEGGGPAPLTRTVRQGHPAEAMTEISADADLLVAGSRGHGGFAGMLRDSVRHHYVTAHLDFPVVVRPAPRPGRVAGLMRSRHGIVSPSRTTQDQTQIGRCLQCTW